MNFFGKTIRVRCLGRQKSPSKNGNSAIDLYTANNIPGMIEPNEQHLLFELASELNLNSDDHLIEFGTFFGRSTWCLAEGLGQNPSAHHSNKLYAYDSFSCSKSGSFVEHVFNFAAAAGVHGMISQEEDRISFRKVFDHYLKKYIDHGIVNVMEFELKDSQPPSGVIALMHVDSPKFYEEFKYVLTRFFPRLKPGSVVIFQDYFYQWSASLVATIQLLVEANILTFRRSIASSMVAEVLEVPTLSVINSIETYIKTEPLNELIDRAMDVCADIPLDRPEQFFPRLSLCKIQHHWDNGDYRQAADIFKSIFREGKKINPLLIDDFSELMANDFSTRKLYELDHI